MTQIDHTWIIKAFGGIRPMAKALNHDLPSTVQGWASRKVIPARQQPDVLRAARRLNLDISEQSFFQTKAPRQLRVVEARR